MGLNGWWNTDEILYGLNHSGSRVLVADGPRFARVAGHLDEVPTLEARPSHRRRRRPTTTPGTRSAYAAPAIEEGPRATRLPGHRDRTR
ncbi:MAG: hypothetical protein R2716_07685 [Microthrixaceae bacterium]